MIDFNKADISENELLETFGSEIFQRLLRDHSTFTYLKKVNKDGAKGREDDCHIIWATSDYIENGEGYGEKDQLTIEKITSENDRIIVPRAVKSREQQRLRTQGKAEVFTPSWVCNAQNNLVDEAWFGQKNVFNIPSEDERSWTSTTDKIIFPKEKKWKDYIAENRMEITCGEAPYIVSRYDTTTAEVIPLSQRIGLLDRKMRIVSENCEDENLWLEAARRSLQSIYAYEWQGDNLLLARENVFISMIEYFQAKFGKDRLPSQKELQMWAYVISWNLWQMDGLKMVVPMSCHDIVRHDIFGNEKRESCPACKNGLKSNLLKYVNNHTGIYCRIRDWAPIGEDGYLEELFYKDLINKKEK